MSDDEFPERPMNGLFAQLTPEQKKRALAYEGPENFGPPVRSFGPNYVADLMERTSETLAYLAERDNGI
jgi:hypothetical protein